MLQLYVQTIDVVSLKVSKKAGKDVSPRELEDLMIELGPEALRCRGIWRKSFDSKFMPIVIVNRSYYARTGNSETEVNSGKCICSLKGEVESKNSSVSRYFTSQDYNSGRHSSTQSEHKASCPLWIPPSTGHLHSWRRGFTKSWKIIWMWHCNALVSGRSYGKNLSNKAVFNQYTKTCQAHNVLNVGFFLEKVVGLLRS